MPIEISCTCGRELNLRDELAGKAIRCPACAGTVQVPMPAEEVVEEIAEGHPPRPPALPQRKVDEIDVAPPVRQPERPKEKKKKKKKSVYSQMYGKESAGPMVVMDEGWFGSANGGIIGGTITLLAGVAMLILLLACGGFARAFIFAIVLIVIGLIAILKGLMDLY